MNRSLLELANWGLHIFHSGLIVFVLVAWYPRLTRRLHLWVLVLIAFSWLGVGYFYGWGYCFLTDWHWQLLGRLGVHDLPASYTAYLLQLAGGSAPQLWIDLATGLGLLFACCAQAAVRWRAPA